MAARKEGRQKHTMRSVLLLSTGCNADGSSDVDTKATEPTNPTQAQNCLTDTPEPATTS